MNRQFPSGNDYKSGSLQEFGSNSDYSSGNLQELNTNPDSGASVEPLPESERPRKDGPGGE